MDDPHTDAAYAVCAQLRESGYRALLAGGCVRDMLLGVAPKDYDIATNAKPDEVAAIFDEVIPVGREFGVQIVVIEQTHFEVATFRVDGPYADGRHPSYVEFSSEKEDAKRRDFTINALFFDPETRKVLDYVDGQSDLKANVIRAVGDPSKRFEEDYLRMLRAVRFAARLGYAIDASTRKAITEHAPNVLKTSPERIRDELTKMLTEGPGGLAFRLLDETGLLQQVLPEIAVMKGVEQPPEFHPEGDVFTHTMLCLDKLIAPSPTVALGTLLHDVGKPPTITYEDRIRFNQHEKVGAQMARKICKRLHCSNATTDRVEWLVAQHMRLAVAPDMRESKRKRFVREEGFDELTTLCRADCQASHGDESIINWVEDYRANLAPEAIAPPPLITGRDLIDMGYAPGSIFKEILTAVEDAQLEGRVSTKYDAREIVTKGWPL
jgi:poly(A) polymerase